MIEGLHLLFLEINNLEESLAFYHGLLGCKIESHEPGADPPLVTLRAGELRINLVQQIETMLKRGRGVHFVCGVSDVDDLYQRLNAAGIQVSAPRDEGWGGRFISAQDPDGYRFLFVAWQQKQNVGGESIE